MVTPGSAKAGGLIARDILAYTLRSVHLKVIHGRTYEQFECSFVGRKFNFKKEAQEHEENCPNRTRRTVLIEMIGECRNLLRFQAAGL